MTIISAFGMTLCLLFFIFNFLAKSREFGAYLSNAREMHLPEFEHA
jgi:hypothetical protein